MTGADRRRMLGLYLCSRRAGRTLFGILASCGLATTLLASAQSEPVRGLVGIAVPLFPAVLIAAGVLSPFGELEPTASRPMRSLRSIHLVGLIACAAVALTLAGFVTSDRDIHWLLLRNLAGYVGLAFIGVRLFDAAFASIGSWLLPFAYGALVLSLDRRVDWLWASQPTTNQTATLIAVGLLALGLVLILLDDGRNYVREGDVA